jgi:predicted nucleotidyltransferase
MAGHDAHLSAAEKMALAEIKRRIGALYPVHAFVIFGSKSRGDYGPESDVDLLVVTQGTLSDAERRRVSREVFEANMAHDTLFSTVVIDRATYESSLWQRLPLLQDVAAEGIAV